MARRCRADGRADPGLLDRHQRAAHGLAWVATTVETILRAVQWAERLADAGRLGQSDELAVCIGVAEYVNQLTGGIPMSQSEIFRPHELVLEGEAAQLAGTVACAGLSSMAAAPGRAPR
ncbi:Methylsuccinyl-CoA dehydrogenase [Candidatus Paraburkholderia kirkii]|nr:Methylsuccinyl-CoA dehydrogenase [Candidatus Paraburkholderia kirkii]